MKPRDKPKPHQVSPATATTRRSPDDDGVPFKKLEESDDESRQAGSVNQLQSDAFRPSSKVRQINQRVKAVTRVFRSSPSNQMPVRGRQSRLREQYPMWLLPLHHLLNLTELLPHQELRRQRKLVRRTALMKTIIFVSHQWTSFDHPDHTGRQLRALQVMFQRMLTGDVPTVDVPLSDKATLSGEVKIEPHRWKDTLSNAYIWIDYAGVPQKEKAHTNSTAEGSDGRCDKNNVEEHRQEEYVLRYVVVRFFIMRIQYLCSMNY